MCLGCYQLTPGCIGVANLAKYGIVVADDAWQVICDAFDSVHAQDWNPHSRDYEQPIGVICLLDKDFKPLKPQFVCGVDHNCEYVVVRENDCWSGGYKGAYTILLRDMKHLNTSYAKDNTYEHMSVSALNKQEEVNE